MPSKKLIAHPKCEDLLTVRLIFKVEPLVCQILLATLSKRNGVQIQTPSFKSDVLNFKAATCIKLKHFWGGV